MKLHENSNEEASNLVPLINNHVYVIELHDLIGLCVRKLEVP